MRLCKSEREASFVTVSQSLLLGTHTVPECLQAMAGGGSCARRLKPAEWPGGERPKAAVACIDCLRDVYRSFGRLRRSVDYMESLFSPPFEQSARNVGAERHTEHRPHAHWLHDAFFSAPSFSSSISDAFQLRNRTTATSQLPRFCRAHASQSPRTTTLPGSRFSLTMHLRRCRCRRCLRSSCGKLLSDRHGSSDSENHSSDVKATFTTTLNLT